MAEAIFAHEVQLHGWSQRFSCDSAGTGGWHEGESPDPRTIRTLSDHGIRWVSRARKICRADFDQFDLIIAMDRSNLTDLLDHPRANPEKIKLLLEYAADTPRDEVPDPYYGSPAGFEETYRLCLAGVQGLLQALS